MPTLHSTLRGRRGLLRRLRQGQLPDRNCPIPTRGSPRGCSGRLFVAVRSATAGMHLIMNLKEARVAKARTVAALMRAQGMTPGRIIVPVDTFDAASDLTKEITGKKLASFTRKRSSASPRARGVEILDAAGKVIESEGGGIKSLDNITPAFVSLNHALVPVPQKQLRRLYSVLPRMRLASQWLMEKKRKTKYMDFPVLFSVGISLASEDNYRTVLTVFTPYKVNAPDDLKRFLREYDSIGAIAYAATQRLSSSGRKLRRPEGGVHRPGLNISPSCGLNSSIGCFVIRKERETEPLLLGSGHGLTAYGEHVVGEPVHCVGLEHPAPNETIACIEHVGFDAKNRATQRFDFALAKLRPGVRFHNVLWANNPIASVRTEPPKHGDAVHVFGYRTKSDDAARFSEAEVDIEIYAKGNTSYRFVNQLAVCGETQSASRSGDSGGLLVDSNNRALGLVVSGSHRGGEYGKGKTIATPLQYILNHLNLKLHKAGVDHAVA